VHIELEYSLSPDDYHAFLRAYSKVSKQMPAANQPYRFSRSMLGWVLILAISVMIFVVFHKEGPVRAPAVAPAAPPAAGGPASSVWKNVLPYIIVFVVIWFFFVRLRLGKGGVRQFFKQNPTLADPRRVVIADDGISIQTQTNTNTMAWTHFTFFAETKEFFLLFETNRSAHLLPKRSFPSPDAIASFRAFAQASVGNQPIGFPVQLAATTAPATVTEPAKPS